MRREVGRQVSASDVEDIEDEVGDSEPQSEEERAAMEALLREGVRAATGRRREMARHQGANLDPAGKEKVVLFAQPIETVIALARYLEASTARSRA